MHRLLVLAFLLSRLLPESALADSPGTDLVPPVQAEDPDSLVIEKNTYFLDVEGRYVIVPPGMYLVRARADSELMLIPNRGRQALVIRAGGIAHQEAITEPIAVTVTEQTGEVHVVLLRPEGKGLHAGGAATPMRLRTGDPMTLSLERLHQALARKRPAATLPSP
jgi:hypothetical protein